MNTMKVKIIARATLVVLAIMAIVGVEFSARLSPGELTFVTVVLVINAWFHSILFVASFYINDDEDIFKKYEQERANSRRLQGELLELIHENADLTRRIQSTEQQPDL